MHFQSQRDVFQIQHQAALQGQTGRWQMRHTTFQTQFQRPGQDMANLLDFRHGVRQRFQFRHRCIQQTYQRSSGQFVFGREVLVQTSLRNADRIRHIIHRHQVVTFF